MYDRTLPLGVRFSGVMASWQPLPRAQAVVECDAKGRPDPDRRPDELAIRIGTAIVRGQGGPRRMTSTGLSCPTPSGIRINSLIAPSEGRVDPAPSRYWSTHISL